MVTLQGQHIFLRALEPEDLEFVYAIARDVIPSPHKDDAKYRRTHPPFPPLAYC